MDRLTYRNAWMHVIGLVNLLGNFEKNDFIVFALRMRVTLDKEPAVGSPHSMLLEKLREMSCLHFKTSSKAAEVPAESQAS